MPASRREANHQKYPLQKLPELPMEFPARTAPVGAANSDTRNLRTETESLKQRLRRLVYKLKKTLRIPRAVCGLAQVDPPTRSSLRFQYLINW